MKKISIILFMALLAYSVQLTAYSYSATWAANSEPDLKGYHVYMQQSGNSEFVKIGTVDSNAFAFEYDGAFCLAVTAFDYSNNESAYSTPVCIESTNSYDLNGDGIVDPDDASAIRLHYGRTVDETNGLEKYDLNNDTFIDPEDVDILRQHYGEK